MFSSSMTAATTSTSSNFDDDPFNSSSPSSLFSNLISDLSPLMNVGLGNVITPITSTSMTPTAFIKDKDHSYNRFKTHRSKFPDPDPGNDRQSVADQLIINDQFLQTQEYLASSACYMNEIENFFQELSTQNQHQPITTHSVICNNNNNNNNNNNHNNSNAHSLCNELNSFNFEEFGSAIDPSIFNFRPANDGNTNEIDEEEIDEVEGLDFANETHSRESLLKSNSNNQISVMDFYNLSPNLNAYNLNTNACNLNINFSNSNRLKSNGHLQKDKYSNRHSKRTGIKSRKIGLNSNNSGNNNNNNYNNNNINNNNNNNSISNRNNIKRGSKNVQTSCSSSSSDAEGNDEQYDDYDDNYPLSLNSSSNSNSNHAAQSKPPKFYSRSGQIADPTRGPCFNCHTTVTCYWRKLKGQYHCNACTLFFKRNNYHRSENFGDKPIKRRNRKSKYSQSIE